MITRDWLTTMTRYNAWQNGAMLDALDGLNAAALMQDRGAFFGSILGTCNHLVWADGVWLSRFHKAPMDMRGGPAGTTLYADFTCYAPARRATDIALTAWVSGAPDLTGDLTWYSGVLGREATLPRAQIIAHIFNHQTHHRGQIHAMATSAGAPGWTTDLIFMPEE